MLNSVTQEIERANMLIFSDDEKKIKEGITMLTNIGRKPMEESDTIELSNSKAIGYYFLKKNSIFESFFPLIIK